MKVDQKDFLADRLSFVGHVKTLGTQLSTQIKVFIWVPKKYENLLKINSVFL